MKIGFVTAWTDIDWLFRREYVLTQGQILKPIAFHKEGYVALVALPDQANRVYVLDVIRNKENGHNSVEIRWVLKLTHRPFAKDEWDFVEPEEIDVIATESDWIVLARISTIGEYIALKDLSEEDKKAIETARTLFLDPTALV
ncbi:MAG: hypothetical protein QXU93_08030 [Thermoproteus sp.]